MRTRALLIGSIRPFVVTGVLLTLVLARFGMASQTQAQTVPEKVEAGNQTVADDEKTCVQPTTAGGCTFNLRNGRFWTNVLQTRNERHAFVLGMIDSWEFRSSLQDRIRGAELIVFGGTGNFRTDDLTAMIESTYLQRENLPLPIGWVAAACLAAQRGEWSHDAVMTALRAHLTSLHPGSVEEIDPLRVIFKLRH